MRQLWKVLIVGLLVLLVVDLYIGLLLLPHGLPHRLEASKTGEGQVSVRSVQINPTVDDKAWAAFLVFSHLVFIGGLMWIRKRKTASVQSKRESVE